MSRDLITVFWSGVGSHAADFRGVVAAGEYPGIIAFYDEKGNSPTGRVLRFTGMRKMYVDALRAGVPMFIDSGEYVAASRRAKALALAKKAPTASDRDDYLWEADEVWALPWDDVFDFYEAMADINPAVPLTVVGPDVIGDQKASLAALKKHRKRLRRLMKIKNLEVVIPLQRKGYVEGRKFVHEPGGLNLVSYHRRVMDVLGTNRFVVGIPMFQNSLADAKEAAERIRPKRMHLLAQGLSKADKPQLMQLVKAFPKMHLSIDSIATSGSYGGGGEFVPPAILKAKKEKVKKTGRGRAGVEVADRVTKITKKDKFIIDWMREQGWNIADYRRDPAFYWQLYRLEQEVEQLQDPDYLEIMRQEIAYDIYNGTLDEDQVEALRYLFNWNESKFKSFVKAYKKDATAEWFDRNEPYWFKQLLRLGHDPRGPETPVIASLILLYYAEPNEREAATRMHLQLRRKGFFG